MYAELGGKEIYMERFGISVSLSHVPELDPEFIPLHRFNEAFLRTAKKPFSVAVEGADGRVAACHTFLHGTDTECSRNMIIFSQKSSSFLQNRQEISLLTIYICIQIQ